MSRTAMLALIAFVGGLAITVAIGFGARFLVVASIHGGVF